MNSFIDMFKEMEASISIITETWLKDSLELQDDVDDLLHGSGIGLITLNLRAGRRGVAHGGVAVAYRAAVIGMKQVRISNPRNFEVLVCVGSVEGRARKLVTIAAYVPPGYDVRRGKDCLNYIADAVIEVKRKYREPFITIAGDFNQWDIAAALSDFVDIEEAPVGPTRGTSSIDRIFTCLLYTSPSPRD